MEPLNSIGRFATVVIDPPWQLTTQRPVIRAIGSGLGNPLPYPAMKLEEIKALDVEATLADDAFLFTWVASRFLPGALECVEAWGCEFWLVMTWVKGGGPQYPGSPCFNSETCIVARRGSPKFTSCKAFNIANAWPRREHSEKPEEFYDLLRRVTPAPRLDIFARRAIGGFVSWGNEAPGGTDLPDSFQDVFDM